MMRTGFLKFTVQFGKRLAHHRPSANGRPMMSRMCPTICTGSSAMVLSRAEAVGCRPPQKAKFSGMATMAMALDTAVIDTLSATLPLARCVRMLLTLPGGQQATRIMPNAMLGAGCSSKVSAKGDRGQGEELRDDARGKRHRHARDAAEVLQARVQRNAEHQKGQHPVEHRQRGRVEVEPDLVHWHHHEVLLLVPARQASAAAAWRTARRYASLFT